MGGNEQIAGSVLRLAAVAAIGMAAVWLQLYNIRPHQLFTGYWV